LREEGGTACRKIRECPTGISKLICTRLSGSIKVGENQLDKKSLVLKKLK
jgi:hypothetical protein